MNMYISTLAFTDTAIINIIGMAPDSTCTFFVLCLLAAARFLLVGATTVLEEYERWIVEFDRHYKDEAEKATRFEIFKDNVEFIDNFNRNPNRTFELGINQFADLTNEEFNKMMMIDKMEAPTLDSTVVGRGFRYENDDVPESVDWRAKGAVTAVKNQGDLGVCWSFAAVAAVESINQIKTGRLLSLSEQQIIDCAVDDPCTGIQPKVAYTYIAKNKGLALEHDYPYIGHARHPCNHMKVGHNAPISGYEYAPRSNETAMKQAVAHQPVTVTILIGSREFEYFRGDGVFKGNCGTTLWHSLEVIGYGVEPDGTMYWLVKNSWGTRWGNNGIGKIAREAAGVGAAGWCNIAGWPSYPTWD